MLEGIDHIELVVRDVERTVAFLEGLGMRVIRRTEHHGVSAEVTFAGSDGPVFEIHQAGMQEVIGINHIAFKVKNLEAVVDQIKALGIRIEGGPMVAKSTGRLLANFRDPDGLRMQIVDT